jgi:hypothetical protein
MQSVTVINRLVIKPGQTDEFIGAQQCFAATAHGKAQDSSAAVCIGASMENRPFS